MELTQSRLRVQVLPHAAATTEEKNEEELLLYHKIMSLKKELKSLDFGQCQKTTSFKTYDRTDRHCNVDFHYESLTISTIKKDENECLPYYPF